MFIKTLDTLKIKKPTIEGRPLLSLALPTLFVYTRQKLYTS